MAATTPSQPHRDSGRPSISTTSSSIRSRAAFSTLHSFSAQPVWTTRPSSTTVDGERQPLLDGVVAVEDAVEGVVEVLGLRLGQEADPSRG